VQTVAFGWQAMPVFEHPDGVQMTQPSVHFAHFGFCSP
jgi:hypothetical protein